MLHSCLQGSTVTLNSWQRLEIAAGRDAVVLKVKVSFEIDIACACSSCMMAFKQLNQILR